MGVTQCGCFSFQARTLLGKGALVKILNKGNELPIYCTATLGLVKSEQKPILTTCIRHTSSSRLRFFLIHSKISIKLQTKWSLKKVYDTFKCYEDTYSYNDKKRIISCFVFVYCCNAMLWFSNSCYVNKVKSIKEKECLFKNSKAYLS